MAISNTENLVQLTIPSGVSTSTSFGYPNRVNNVSELVVQETTLTPRIADSITFNQSSDQFTLTGHNLVTGNIVQFNGTAITGFSADTDYYVIRIDANIFQLATSLANAVASPAVPVTTTGTSNVDVTTLIRAGEQPLIRTLELDVDYSATPDPTSGLITSVAIKPLQTAIDNGKFATGSTLTIYRETDFKQESNYEPNGIIPADTLESNLDKLTMMAQQLKDDVVRSVRFSEAVTDPADVKIPFGAEQRAGKILSFDSAGEFSISQEIGVWRSAWQSGRSYAARDLVFNDTEGATDRYSIYIAKVSHTSDSSTAPLQEGTNWDRVLDASHFADQVELAEVASSTAGGASDLAQDWASKVNGIVDSTDYSAKAYAIGGTGVTGAAGSAKDWAIKTDGTVDGTNYSAKHWAGDSESSATAASTSATNAAASESNAATSETNAATSATAAAGSASSASTSATNAASSASSASTSASNAATSETNAATSETNAASSASAASTSESNAATSATAASTSASNAATSATAAASSATAAGTAQTAAETAQGLAEDAQAAAETAYDNFDDRYLGSKTSAPSVDNDGNALLVGALYFDSAAGALRVWDGSAWNSVEALPQPLATTDSPTFAGITATTADINGGTIDDTAIGGTTPAAGSFTQVNAGDGAEATPSITNTGDTNTGIYFPAADTVGVSTNATERMRIDSSGHVIVPNGITLGTAAGTYAAANTLDDYEEGTWTPQFVDSSGNNNCAAANAFNGAYYTKIGNLVTCSFRWNVSGGTAVDAYLRGIPFSPSTTSGKSLNVVILASDSEGIAYWRNDGSDAFTLAGKQLIVLSSIFRAQFSYFTD